MSECPTCDGNGYLEGQPAGPFDPVKYECPDCGGSGEVDPEEMREAAQYRADEARWQDDRTAYAG